MANVDKPNGFKPVMHLNGSPYNGQARKYMISASDSTIGVAVGDLVVLSDQAALSGYAAVEGITAGAVTAADVVGAVVALLPFNETGLSAAGAGLATLDVPGNTYRAASALRYCLVADSPDLIFEAQEDGSTLTLASVGLNVGFLSAAPSTSTGASQQEIDSSSVADTLTLPLQIMGFVNTPKNEVGANARWLVRINTHAYHPAGQTGV